MINRHFVKSAIPAVRFANPSLRISFEQVPTVKRRKHAGAGAAQKAAEAAPVSEEDEATAVWKQPPSLTVTFSESLVLFLERAVSLCLSVSS